MRRTLSALLVHKKLPWLLAALAVALTAPSLAVGLQLDDYLHEQLILQGNLAAVLMRLFLFWDNDPAAITRWLDYQRKLTRLATPISRLWAGGLGLRCRSIPR